MAGSSLGRHWNSLADVSDPTVAISATLPSIGDLVLFWCCLVIVFDGICCIDVSIKKKKFVYWPAKGMRRKNMNRKDMITIAFSIARVYQRSHRKRLVNSLLLLLIPPSPFSSSLSSSLSSLSYCFVCFVWFLFRKRHESALICLEFRRFRSCAFQSNGAMCVCVWGRGETSQKFTSDNRCSRRLIRPLRMNRRSDLLSAAARNESARYLAVRSRLVSVWVSTILGRVISTLWLFSLSLSLSFFFPHPRPPPFTFVYIFSYFFLLRANFSYWLFAGWFLQPRFSPVQRVHLLLSSAFHASFSLLWPYFISLKTEERKKKMKLKFSFFPFFFEGRGDEGKAPYFLLNTWRIC